MDIKGKEGSFAPLIIVMLASLVIAFFWNSFPLIKNIAHNILDPVLSPLLSWNLTGGMAILVFLITLITTVIQKYATDQKTLKEMKDEQKKLNEEMKEFKDHPEKLMELQKKQFEFMGPMMKLSMRPMIFTGIPFILLFRWFFDYFEVLGDPKFFGFLTWFWFYLIGSIIFSSILRKIIKVV
jgi:uncharacterized membrane protein (DUF106 family)